MWAISIITYATIAMFSDITKITAPSATAYASVTALLTVVIGFYQWSRSKDDIQK